MLRTLYSLPNEILLDIVKKIPVESLAGVRGVSHRLKQVVDDPSVWVLKTKQKFGVDNSYPKHLVYAKAYYQLLIYQPMISTLLAFLGKNHPDYTSLKPVFSAPGYPRESASALRSWSALNSETAKMDALPEIRVQLITLLSFLLKPPLEDEEDFNPFVVAINDEDMATIELFLSLKNFDINALTGERCAPALFYAVSWHKSEIVKRLLKDPRINVNIADEHGITPLHEATVSVDIVVCEALLAHKDIDPNLHGTSEGNTALTECMSCHWGDGFEEEVCLPYVQAILAHPKFDPSILDKRKMTAESLATSFSYTECARLISEKYQEQIFKRQREQEAQRQQEWEAAQKLLFTEKPLLTASKRKHKTDIPRFEEFKREFASDVNLPEGRLRLIYRVYAEKTDQLDALMFLDEIPNETAPSHVEFNQEEAKVLQAAVDDYHEVNQPIKFSRTEL